MEKEKISWIEGYIADSLRRNSIYGSSYSISTENEIIKKFIGTQGDGKYNVPIKEGMIYDLASLTKVVGTTTRILQLIADGKLGLKTRVGQILTNLNYSEIMIENLLLHNSGLPADVSNAKFLTKEELVKEIKEVSLIKKPGIETIYSDLGFIILGWVIEKIDGNLKNSFDKNIFRPLKMKDTGYNLSGNPLSKYVPTENEIRRGGVIQGEVHDYKAYLLNGISGHAGVFSTLNDLDNFVKMYIDHGKFEGRQILEESVFDCFTQYNKNGRTLGWQVWNHDISKLWHTGFTGTSIAIDLVEKTSFVCLTNRVYPNRNNDNWIKDRKKLMEVFFEK